MMTNFVTILVAMVVGAVIGTVMSPPNLVRKEVYITSARISDDLVTALGTTGCLYLPLWDQYGVESVQICTLQEADARGWRYTKEQLEQRMKQND